MGRPNPWTTLRWIEVVTALDRLMMEYAQSTGGLSRFSRLEGQGQGHKMTHARRFGSNSVIGQDVIDFIRLRKAM